MYIEQQPEVYVYENNSHRMGAESAQCSSRKSIAQKAEKLRIDELCLWITTKQKLRIYGGMASHVANLLCPKMKFMLTTDSIEAVKNADYVITTIRVGEDEMRAKDERIALNHGVLGQETTERADFLLQ